MAAKKETSGIEGTIIGIENFSLHNGPGIRSTLFLKGCPLSCLWCANPESQSAEPEVLFNRELCIPGCDCCLQEPPAGLITRDAAGNINLDRASGSPDALLQAARQCPSGALVVTGKRVNARETAAELLRDRSFFRESGGGVTISGGEPLMQPRFAYAVASIIRSEGVHTAVDTCGEGNFADLERLASVADLILFDIKGTDSGLHREWTGRENRRILDNLSRLLSLPAPPEIRLRLPFIPGMNGAPERIEQTALLLESLGVHEVDILPYHRLGTGKYTQLGRDYSLRTTPAPEPAALEKAKQQFASRGITVRIED